MKPAAWQKTQPGTPVTPERSASRTPRQLSVRRDEKQSAGVWLQCKITKRDARLGHGLAAHETLGRLGDGLDAPRAA
jgi:hypothetical protein